MLLLQAASESSRDWYELWKVDWFAGDFPSWIAAVLALVAVVIAQRALRPSYIEFHSDPEINIGSPDPEQNQVVVKATRVSYAAYNDVKGWIRIVVILPRFSGLLAS
jgi:hypothetical protein